MAYPLNSTHRCPHLGVPDDPESWFTFPTVEHLCYYPLTPQPISLDYQARVCLSADYVNCPVFQAQERPGQLPRDLLPEWERGSFHLRRWVFGILAVIISLLIGLALLSVVSDSPFSIIRTPETEGATAALADTQTFTPSPTEAFDPSPAQPALVEPTEAPTVTPMPTATTAPTSTRTPTATPSPTQEPVETAGSDLEMTLAYGSNLREGPGAEYAVIFFIEAGTRVKPIARDLDGFWLYIQTPRENEGWLAVTQIQESIDISQIPVAEATPTLPPTETPSSSEGG